MDSQAVLAMREKLVENEKQRHQRYKLKDKK